MIALRRRVCCGTALCCSWPLLLLQLQPALERVRQPSTEQLSAPENPAEDPLILPGVVIEEIPEDSALKKAGIQPGDVILAWERLPNPPANPEGASGRIESPFDWMWVEIEQAPRGVVKLTGLHSSKQNQWVVLPCDWMATVRPNRSTIVFGKQNPTLAEEPPNLRSVSLEDTSRRTVSERWPQTAAGALWVIFDEARRLSERRSWKAFDLQIDRLSGFARDEQRIAQALLHLGAAAEKTDNLDRAGQLLSDSCSKLEKNEPSSLLYAKCLSMQGVVAMRRGAHEEALGAIATALEIRRQNSPGSLIEAASEINIGAVLRTKGYLEKASEALERALKIHSTSGCASRNEPALLTNLATLAGAQGDLPRAEELLERALEAALRWPDGAASSTSALANLATVAERRQDYSRAEELYRQAMAILEVCRPNSLELARLYASLAIIADRRGDGSLADAYIARAMAILEARAGRKTLPEAILLEVMARVSRRAGRLDEAANLYSRALSIFHMKSPGGDGVVASLNGLGILSSVQGEVELANSYFLRALHVQRGISTTDRNFATILTNLGKITRLLNHPRQSFRYLEQALALLERLGLRSSDALSEMAKLERLSGRPLVARTLFRDAIDALGHKEHSMTETRIDEIQLKSTLGYDLFREAIDVDLDLGESERALGLAEKARAQTYLTMTAARDPASSMSSAKLESEQRRLDELVETRLRELERRTSEQDPLALPLSLRELQLLRNKQRQLRDNVLGHTGEPSLTRDARSLDATSVAEAIDQGTGLIIFNCSERRAAILLLDSQGKLLSRFAELSRVELRQRVERFLQLLPEARSGTTVGDLKLKELRHLGKELYSLLLAPIANRIEKAERVMIVADGPLHHLPFAALTREVMGEDGVARDQYLAEWKPFHSVLSATVFAELKKDRRDPTKPDDGTALQLVAFGDPEFPATLTSKEPDKIADIRVRSAAREGRLELARLPHTRREIEGIAALFPPERTRTYLGSDATEERAKEVGKGARILHFATHARLDDRFPLNSSLLLTMPEGFPEDRENGLLQVWEIFERVRLDADLVVLSACESGLGEEQGGEGLIGLTRAFQYAGARSVLASLWEVRDEATAELMIRFYRHLTSGKSKDQALQAAQRELLAGPIEVPGPDGTAVQFDASAPYYWAAFQVYGDWQ